MLGTTMEPWMDILEQLPTYLKCYLIRPWCLLWVVSEDDVSDLINCETRELTWDLTHGIYHFLPRSAARFRF